MEFDETPRFWCPCVALVTWINFAFSPDENLQSDFHRSEKETKRTKNKNKIKSLLTLSPSLQTKSTLIFLLWFFFIFLLLLLLFWIHGLYCFIRARFYSETIYFFLVHFILNELSSSHFLTSKIFVKISSLKSLATYHPENCKIF